MTRGLLKTVLSVFLLSLATAGHAAIVFHQGPATGTDGGNWINQTASQNLADRATLATTTSITEISIWTTFAPVAGTVHVKILADSGSSTPGTLLYSEDKAPDSWVLDTGSFYKVTVILTTPFPATGGTTYWYGIVSAQDDGQMAVFSGSTYSDMVGIGDQMFELAGDAVVDGTLILEKQTDPNDPNTVFTFDTSAVDPNDPDVPDLVELSDDEQATLTGVDPGTYRVDELPIPGWELTLVDCSVDIGTDDTLWDPNDPNDASGADIVVGAGQTVTCVFNNRRLDATLDVTKTVSPTAISAGDTVTWTVTITNTGPDPAEAVTLIDDLPDGVAHLSSIASPQGSCSEAGGVVTCDLGTIAADQTVTVEIEAEVQIIGEIVNEVSVSGNSGFATGAAAAPAVSSAATDVPVDDPWMLGLLLVALAIAGTIALRR